jgi:hypothetical protein
MRLILLLSFMAVASVFHGQNSSFALDLEPMEIPGLGGLQAYAFGIHEGKWLVVGGRLDGLHRRQPFASFNAAGNNNRLIVVDPVSSMQWSLPLTSLSESISDQLSSTNMEFHQDGEYLYIAGGYGISSSTGSKITFPSLISIHLPSVIDNVINEGLLAPHIIQVMDEQMAVTGGHLKKIANEFYLIGGNRFDGNYNPMGNPTYTQVYVNGARKFLIQNDGINLDIIHQGVIDDEVNLHRRDYNAVPQIMPDGTEAITVFSGVFQPNVDLPYLNSVTISSEGIDVTNPFQQYYNHYHCAVLPLYSAQNQEMHSVFFGGIAQYYDSLGVLVQDNNVPFVKTIARVTRSSNGEMQEFIMPLQMPGYLGASAEFIPLEEMPSYNNDVIKLDEIANDTTLVGYIYGGINSTAKNIFFTNTGAESTASSVVFKVKLIKQSLTEVDQLNTEHLNNFDLIVLPNPYSRGLKLEFSLNVSGPVDLLLIDMNGKTLLHEEMPLAKAGKNVMDVSLDEVQVGNGAFLLSLQSNGQRALRKVILN